MKNISVDYMQGYVDAKSEIVHCRACIHFDDCGYCNRSKIYVHEDEYCSRGDRMRFEVIRMTSKELGDGND